MVPSIFATIVEARLDREPIHTSSVCVVPCGAGKGVWLRFGQKIIMVLKDKQVCNLFEGGFVNNTVCVRFLCFGFVCLCMW